MLTNSYIVELPCRKSLLICKINRGRWCTNSQSENGVFVGRVRYDQREHAVPSSAYVHEALYTNNAPSYVLLFIYSSPFTNALHIY